MAALARADSAAVMAFFRLVRASRLVSSRCRAAWFWSRRFLRSACSAVRACCWAAGSGRLAVSPACSARVWAALWAAASSLEKASRLLAAASSAACRVRRCFWVSARAAAIAAASGQGRFFCPSARRVWASAAAFSALACAVRACSTAFAWSGRWACSWAFWWVSFSRSFLRDSAFAMRSCTSARPRRRLSCWACRAVCSSSGVRASACGPV